MAEVKKKTTVKKAEPKKDVAKAAKPVGKASVKKHAAPVKSAAAVTVTELKASAATGQIATSPVTKKGAQKEKTLTIDVFGLDGKVTGKVSLPEAIFGEKVNKKLLAQAVRVYLANKRQGTVSTKTRGEVEGSSRKIYRQKGTGRARHGSVRAPIFVHGGVVFGPKPRDYSLDLPKKMRRKALFSALSAKYVEGEIKVLAGLEKLEPKTKLFVGVLESLGIASKKRSMLVVCPNDLANVRRAAGNVQGVTLTAARRLNAYDVLKYKDLLFMRDAIDEIEKTFLVK